MFFCSLVQQFLVLGDGRNSKERSPEAPELGFTTVTSLQHQGEIGQQPGPLAARQNTAGTAKTTSLYLFPLTFKPKKRADQIKKLNWSFSNWNPPHNEMTRVPKFLLVYVCTFLPSGTLRWLWWMPTFLKIINRFTPAMK